VRKIINDPNDFVDEVVDGHRLRNDDREDLPAHLIRRALVERLAPPSKA